MVVATQRFPDEASREKLVRQCARTESRDVFGKVVHGLSWAVLSTVLMTLLVTGLPGFFGMGTVRVMGGSMGRRVPIGSVAIVRKQPADQVRVGDIILFAPGHARVATLHRVVKLERHDDGIMYATTRGDANKSADAEAKAMRGSGSILVASVPFVGYVATMLQSSLGWFAVLQLAAVQMLLPKRTRRRRASGSSVSPVPSMTVATG